MTCEVTPITCTQGKLHHCTSMLVPRLDAALVLLGLWVSGCRRHHDHLATVEANDLHWQRARSRSLSLSLSLEACFGALEVVACRLLECQDVHPALRLGSSNARGRVGGSAATAVKARAPGFGAAVLTHFLQGQGSSGAPWRIAAEAFSGHRFPLRKAEVASRLAQLPLEDQAKKRSRGRFQGLFMFTHFLQAIFWQQASALAPLGVARQRSYRTSGSD